jgi:hypothetical protein
MADVTLAKGATFSLTYDYTPDAGGETDLSNSVITSGLLDAAEAYHPLTVTVAEDNLSFTLTADTSGWAVGKGIYDVKVSTNGVVWFFPKAPVFVTTPITQS